MDRRPVLALTCVVALASCLTVQAQHDTFFPPEHNGDGIRYPMVFAPMIWAVQGPVAIAPVSDGLVHLAYTLRVTNAYGGPLKINKLEVVDPFANNKPVGKNHVVATDNQDITGLVNLLPAPPGIDRNAYTDTLNAGASGVTFLDVTFPDLDAVPAFLSHRFTVTQVDASGVEQKFVITDPPTAVDRRMPIVLSPPLHGPRWIDGDSCCEQIGGHRWARTPINGRAETAEGFASDLIQLREDGRIYAGPIDKLSSYAYYGVDVYCAGPGKVVEVVRDQADETPGTNPAHITALTAAGNHVIVEMEGKRYAMYAHFAPNSIPVHVGDSVKTGQLLGKLGNSGSSSAPHLHFQVMDQPSSLDARGLPYVFDRITRRVRFSGSMNEEGRQTVAGEPLTLVPAPNPFELHEVMPRTFDVIDFP
jgi:hypothetical protein